MPGTLESAIAGIAAAHLSIKVANGYATDVKFVTRHYREPELFESSQLPAVMVYRTPGTAGKVRGMDRGLYEEELTLSVMGVIEGTGQNPDDAALATLAEAFLADLKILQDAASSAAGAPIVPGTYGVPDVKSGNVVSDYNDVNYMMQRAFLGIGLTIKVAYNALRP